jgi:hypothetical protein
MSRRTVLLRIAALVLGAGFSVFAVLIRYSPQAISAARGWVYFRFYRSVPNNWLRVSVPVLILVALALLVGLLALPAVRQALRNLVRDRPRRIWLAAVLVVFLLTMLPLDQPGDTPYSTQLEIWVYLVFGLLGTVFLMLGLEPWLECTARPLGRIYDSLMKLRPAVFLSGCAVFVFLAANVSSYFIFHHIPHIHDTVAQIFQARLFAQGKLYAQSPPLPEFFDVMHIINNGRWYSQYPPGHPLLLMLGVLINAPWLINPVFGALTVIVIYHLGKEVYDERTARLGALLATLSPFLVFMSSEFMNHSTALFFAALFLLLYARAFRRPSVESCPIRVTCNSQLETRHALLCALLAGLSLGIVFLIRPQTAVFLAAPLLFDAGYRVYREPGRHVGKLAALIAGGSVMVVVLLVYNYLTNGNPFLLGYVVRYGSGHGLGFGHSGWGEAYTPARAVVLTSLEMNGLNRYLFEFPIPALLFMAVLFLTRTRDRWDWLLLGTLVALVVGYFFYWWHSMLFGPRWEFEALPALVLLSARGIRAVPKFTQEDLGLAVPVERTRNGLLSLFLIGYLSMFAVALPTLVKDYQGGFGVLHKTAQTVKRSGIHNALVFSKKYDETFLENRLTLDGDVVYARDLGELNPVLTRLYPERKCYWAHRDTLRELKDMDFDHSALKEALDSTIALLGRRDLSGYQTLIWPLAELEDMLGTLPVFAPKTGGVPIHAGPATTDYRELSQRLVNNMTGFKQIMPALGVWVLRDRSQGLVVFSLMDGQQDFIVGDYQFTHLATTVNGRIAIYDIRVTGEPVPEHMLPKAAP